VKLLADVAPLRESPAFRRLWAGSTLSAPLTVQARLRLDRVGLLGDRAGAPGLPPLPHRGGGRPEPVGHPDARMSQGPIIGETLNGDFSRPNWYMTSATRWIRTLSIAVG
jgi:hypothetical protein